MKKAEALAELSFTVRERQRLAKALSRAETARLFRRLQAVLLVAQGRDVADVTSVTGLARSSVYHLVKQYVQTRQVANLQDRVRSGRPKVAPEITDQRILDELKHSPLALGYRTNVWTVKLLAEHLSARYKCQIAERTLRRRMKHGGLRCTRPRYVYSEKEPHLAQKKGQLSGA